MGATDELKRLVAERAAREQKTTEQRKALARSERRWGRIRTVLFARIDRAAPWIDEGCPPDKWLPSTLLKLLYFVSATAERPEAVRDATISILKMLELARRRFRNGEHPNPFLETTNAK